jgi:hypothetical protein
VKDVFDEAKGKPKAIPAAYKFGGQLCNMMIAALDERDQPSCAPALGGRWCR